MRLTLDWDTEEERSDHFESVRDRQSLLDLDNAWQLRQSSGGDGYHYQEWDAYGDWPSVVQARENYGDDPKRLRLDKKRHGLGSPFLSVLYDTKYMGRWGWDKSSGNSVEVIDGSEVVTERIKFNGLLDYHKIARTLVSDVYGTQAGLAESIGMGASTVSGWVNNAHGVSEAAQKKLKRRARHHGIGHYRDDKSQEKHGKVVYPDPEENPYRRTIVEYCDTPWSEEGEAPEEGLEADERDYAKLNVHTGSYNDAHTEEQLKAIHDKVVEHVLDRLSPTNFEGTKMGGPDGLDRDTMRPVNREEDSVNYEAAVLDRDEASYYLARFVSQNNATRKGIGVPEARKQPLAEVLLWDEDMTSVIWQCMVVWTGSSVRDATVVKDTQRWW